MAKALTLAACLFLCFPCFRIIYNTGSGHGGWFVVSAAEKEEVCQAQARPDQTCRDDGPQQIFPPSDREASTTNTQRRPVVGSLRPWHLPGPVVFTNFTRHSTVVLVSEKERTLEVAEGSVTQINHSLQQQDEPSTNEEEDADPPTAPPESTNAYSTEFSVLRQALPRSSVAAVLQLLEQQDYPYLDEDPDTVDGMPTYELFVDAPDLYDHQTKTTTTTTKVPDTDPHFVPDRTRHLRDQLQRLLQPYLTTVMTPYVQHRYPHQCRSKDPSRHCTPCYSMVRRYRHGDRVSHATHHDGHALVTVVVSLSDYDVEYRGGLYVSTGFGQRREYVALDRGDAVVHQSTLLHGVHVYDIPDTPERTQRWSWIVWYRDSTTCHDHSYEWFAACAADGHPLCQQLHATKVGHIPGMSPQDIAGHVVDLNLQAARGGAGMAAVKIARAYLHHLPSPLPFSVDEAARYYRRAVASHHPDGHYGLAQLLLQMVTFELLQQPQQQPPSSSSLSSRGTTMDTTQIYQDPRVVEAVQHLEAAAWLGHAYAQFNLGMVHTYGYATGVVNGTLAGDWFEASGLPEGYYLAAQQAKAVGNRARYQWCGQRAQALGFAAPWRTRAREATGSGGAAGVSLNLPWPPARDGRQPPQL